ncbi:MAG: hypothetical protein EZS28_040689 [Streblomastix strix]|uniref:Uncharacterized protein n=1 Tax=Streblomastix strix TaxID=222440 RepID=A0A5J4U2C7_9EUKA|nr:MAG: hypothetical protein EZS28_040689 [Streblomastix strix]
MNTKIRINTRKITTGSIKTLSRYQYKHWAYSKIICAFRIIFPAFSVFLNTMQATRSPGHLTQKHISHTRISSAVILSIIGLSVSRSNWDVSTVKWTTYVDIDS